MTSNDKKIRVGVLCGGRSAEHDISLSSAKYVVDILDKSKYDIDLISIDRDGKWFSHQNPLRLLESTNPKLTDFKRDTVLPVKVSKTVDIVFPVLHGPYGEDGTVQGLLKLADVPFVGPSVLSSSLCMDKEVSKRLLKAGGVSVADFLVMKKNQPHQLSYDEVSHVLGDTFFVKPCNSGSSIGISKVKSPNDFQQAVDYAFKYDNKIIFEEAIVGREFECAVVGNDIPEVSVPGEVISHNEFFDYNAKYIDKDAATFVVPAKISDDDLEKVTKTVSAAYQILCCQGMGRVDFFMREDEVYINEINTLPGLAPFSLFPVLWKKSGLKEQDLLDKIINLAFERHDREKSLATTYIA